MGVDRPLFLEETKWGDLYFGTKDGVSFLFGGFSRPFSNDFFQRKTFFLISLDFFPSSWIVSWWRFPAVQEEAVGNFKRAERAESQWGSSGG